QKLGFAQIRALLRNYCVSELGIQRVDSMTFLTGLPEISVLLLQNREMLSLLAKGEPMPFTGYFDPAPLIPMIRTEGSFLEEESFHMIIQSLQSAVGAARFLANSSDAYPNLHALG